MGEESRGPVKHDFAHSVAWRCLASPVLPLSKANKAINNSHGWNPLKSHKNADDLCFFSNFSPAIGPPSGELRLAKEASSLGLQETLWGSPRDSAGDVPGSDKMVIEAKSKGELTNYYGDTYIYIYIYNIIILYIYIYIILYYILYIYILLYYVYIHIIIYIYYYIYILLYIYIIIYIYIFMIIHVYII